MDTMLESIKSQEDAYQLRTYAKFPLSIERGRGCYVYDQQDREYLDFYSGHAVASTGHCHPHVVKAIQDQASRLLFYSNITYNRIRAEGVTKLLQLSGSPYSKVFLASSGSEANENAIKLARAVSGRPEVLSLLGSFHGRTYGSLSATGIAKYRDYLNTPVSHHRILPAAQVADHVSKQTAAVVLEPIQSMNGVWQVPPKVLSAIEESCRKQGAFLIFDEVQTGVGRTGTFLYAGHHGVYPDMVTLAKGIASGFPASALLVTETLATKVACGDLGTTFGGGPLACAALKATLEVIEKERLAENAARMGEYLSRALKTQQNVLEVRGQGLLLGIRLKDDLKAKHIQQALFNKRVLAGTSSHPQVLRLMPPLILPEEIAGQFLKIWETL